LIYPGNQGGVVAHAQIALEPHQRGRACHRANLVQPDIGLAA
jgi:hypothetical protein